MPEIKTLKQIDVKKKRALLRVDFNVPLGENMKIDENEKWRIEATLPTIRYLIKQKAKIIIISHLGRPASPSQGGPREKKKQGLSLQSTAWELGKLLKKKIQFSEKIVGWKVKKKIERMKFGDVLMLENIRFHSGEEKNSPKLAKELASLGDIFINDAFAVSHREHASLVGIPKYLPSVLGLLFVKEIQELDKILKKPKQPLIAVIGGAKIATKIKVISKLLKIADKVLIGGSLANDIFAAQGIFMGDSIIDKKSFSEVKKINLENPKLFLPVDLVSLFGSSADEEEIHYREIHDVGKGEKALDIGPKTINLFCDLIKQAKTIIWNGPLGFYTQEPFNKASKEIVEAIARSKAYSIVGGGETVAFLREIKKEKTFNHISTGGGAMLDYLANETLSGLLALEK